MEARVSVVIPVYNRERYVTECVESVLGQSHSSFEILLVDDGSTDATPRLCRELAAKDSRIRLLQGSHQGVSAARNLALDHAQGEYVFFLDSDDIIYPKLFEVLVEAMERTGAMLGGTGFLTVPEAQWESTRQRFLAPGRENCAVFYTNAEAIEKLFHTMTPLSAAGGVILRRSLLEQTRFRTDLFIGEDFYFNYENLLKGADVVFLEKKWYIARDHDCCLSGDFTYRGFLTRFERRKLVWESEDRLGRPQNANMQKRDCLFIYLECVKKSGIFSDDGKKMRAVLREHRSVLLSGLTGKLKLIFFCAVYLPITGKIFNRMLKK